jgi:hypothetical protein
MDFPPPLAPPYKTAQEAAIAYDQAAIEHYGEFACTNKKLGLLDALSNA